MSQKGPFIVFRLIGLLLVIGLIVGGGFMAYRAGYSQGVVQSPKVAAAIEKAAQSGQGVAPAVPPMMYGNGYGYYPRPYGYGPHFGFFPFGICGSILFVFLIFGLFRMIFFRHWHGGHMHHGPWGRHWEGGVPPMFSEWHKRAHGESTPSDSEPSKPEG